MNTSIAQDGVGCFFLSASIPFLFFIRLTRLSLTLIRADFAVAGFRYLNNKLNFYFSIYLEILRHWIALGFLLEGILVLVAISCIFCCL